VTTAETAASLEGLNPAQEAAVTHGAGPLLILAGAGTGKTAVLTRRIAYLIATKRARPEEILALTFTEKAAAEMEARVDLLTPYGTVEAWIGTFHAFGDSLIREHAFALGLHPDVRVLTRAEQAVFVQERLFQFPLQYYRPLSDPGRYVDALLGLISRAKDEDVSVEAYRAYAAALGEEARAGDAAAAHPDDAALAEEAARQVELAEAYATYERLRAEAGLLDFGDQVALALRLLREHPAILKEIRARFRYILVDEFQDTNTAQWELVRLLAEPHRNITVVGDDDQAIYRFRGAALTNILHFTTVYPDASRLVLTDCYRCPQGILDAAYRLIRHNDPHRLEVQEHVDKRLLAVRGPGPASGPAPQHLTFERHEEEADGVARLIADRISSGRYRHRDIAILVRTNREADPYLRALNLQGIPWHFSGARRLFARPEVRLCMAFLRTLADPEDAVSLTHLLGSAPYGLPPLDLARLAAAARHSHRPLLALCRQAAGLEPPDPAAPPPDISPDGMKVLEKACLDLEGYARLAQDHRTGEVLYRFLTDSGWLNRLAAARDARSEEELRNLAELFKQASRFEAVAREDRVAEFVRYQDRLIEAGEEPAAAEVDPDLDAVRVLTVHKAKGLEFPCVILVDLVADRFPSRARRDPIALPPALLKAAGPPGDVHRQEERRLFYVGMTRAQEDLCFTHARDHGGARPRKVSPFVLEALDVPRPAAAPTLPSPLEVIARAGTVAEPALPPPEPIPADAPLTLSHYTIDDYLTCPLKFKYVHILQVPIREHHAVIYGKALHEAVQAYLKRRQRGEAMAADEVRAVFERAWVSRGFLSREHEEQRLAAGREALRRFVAHEEASPFRPARIEQPFAFHRGATQVRGRFDRVDARPEGAVIIDYKSSDIRAQKDADRRVTESLQLALYALAHREATGSLPGRLEMHFLETGLTGTAVPGPETLARAEEAIQRVAAGLRARDYTATPGYQQCGACAYREICPSSVWGGGR
jgi:DNA helicase-2/ATP-dependent DNA helicase PcrA